MKSINYILLFAALFMFGSCSDYLDINEDPNRSSSAEPDAIFPSVTLGYSNNRVIDLGPAVSTASQSWSGGGELGAGVFTSPEQYNFSVFTTGNTWRAYYRDIQKDLKLAIRNAEGRENAIAQCEIVSALTYYSATTLWGDVPFSQAVDVDFETGSIRNKNPEFDPQQDVLNGIVDLLDQAIARIDPSLQTSITNADLIYNGNMDSWRRLAKSLKLRTLMTISEADPSVAPEIGALVSELDLIVDPSQNAEFPFFAEAGNQNPFWGTLRSFAGGLNFFYFASEAMVETMKSRNDPRLDAYFTPYPGGGSPDEVTGAPAGVVSLPAIPWVLSTSAGGDDALVRPDAPDVIFSAQETHYLIAEAIAKGYASGDADQILRDGIRIAMSQFGLDATDYLANEIPDINGLPQAEAVGIISEQLFIDCIIRPVEAFAHWRRNEVPALSVPDGAVTTGLFRRLPYPPDEIAANTNAPETSPQPDVRMWFDQ